MGWETEITILAEGIRSAKEARTVAINIYEKDAKTYGPLSCYTKELENLFFHYERRKYAPYWVIQSLSENYRHIKFTILASCPQFINGPTALIRICNGKILDSYGIGEFEVAEMRRYIIMNPLKFIQVIYEWFKFGGKEESLRMVNQEEFPLEWCEENYEDKIVPIQEPKVLMDLVRMPTDNSAWKTLELNFN